MIKTVVIDGDDDNSGNDYDATFLLVRVSDQCLNLQKKLLVVIEMLIFMGSNLTWLRLYHLSYPNPMAFGHDSQKELKDIRLKQ